MKFLAWAKKNWLLWVVVAAYALLATVNLDDAKMAAIISAKTFASVAVTLITVFVFVGLFQVWMREEFILKHLGKEAGFRGLFLGAALGTAIHGPLVGVFPLLKTLLDKGARLGVVVAIVSTWAIKVPMIPLELRFFGWKFTLARQLLLFASAFIMAPLMERLIGDVSRFRGLKGEEQ
ncbi:MAG: permease [Firmicutes bacterium]|nr:permease [Bacillota bacterium]